MALIQNDIPFRACFWGFRAGGTLNYEKAGYICFDKK
jgi:hypothetical protein